MSPHMLSSSKGQLLVCSITWYPHRLLWFQSSLSQRRLYSAVQGYARSSVAQEFCSFTLYYIIARRATSLQVCVTSIAQGPERGPLPLRYFRAISFVPNEVDSLPHYLFVCGSGVSGSALAVGFSGCHKSPGEH